MITSKKLVLNIAIDTTTASDSMIELIEVRTLNITDLGYLRADMSLIIIVKKKLQHNEKLVFIHN